MTCRPYVGMHNSHCSSRERWLPSAGLAWTDVNKLNLRFVNRMVRKGVAHGFASGAVFRCQQDSLYTNVTQFVVANVLASERLELNSDISKPVPSVEPMPGDCEAILRVGLYATITHHQRTHDGEGTRKHFAHRIYVTVSVRMAKGWLSTL